MSVFAAYFDESGSHSDDFLVVAGYTGEVDRWADFSARWNALLESAGVSHVHMKTFRQKKSRVFSHLSHSEKQRLLGALLELIKETALLGSFAIISPRYYDRATTAKFRSAYGSAFTACAAGVASLSVANVQRLRPGNHRVGMFFEHGHKNVMQALDFIRFQKSELEEIDATSFRRVAVLGGAHPWLHPPNDPLRKNTAKIGTIGLGSRMDMPPLQAADILAYCVYSALLRKEPEFGKGVIDEIEKSVPHYLVHISPELIKKLVEGCPKADEDWKAFMTEAHNLAKDAKALGIKLVTTGDAIGFTGKGSIPDEMRARYLRLLGVSPKDRT